MSAELVAKGQALLDAAYDYWQAMQRAGKGGALFWLDDSSGRTVIFTRGEYRPTLLYNVDQIRFGEQAVVRFDTLNTAPGNWDEPLDRDLALPREAP